MTRNMLTRAVITAAALCLPAAGAESEAKNPLAAFHPLWTRGANAGTAAADPKVRRADAPSIRVEHRGPQDWCLTSRSRQPVREGDLFELSAWVKVQGAGAAEVGVVTYDAAGKVVEWMYGLRSARGPTDWRHLRGRFVVPRGVAAIVPRLTGTAPATVWMDAFQLTRTGNLSAMRGKSLPKSLTIANDTLSVTFETADATLTVTDRRARRTWTQQPVGPVAVVQAEKTAKTDPGIAATLLDPASGLDVRLTLRLAGKLPELAVTLAAEGELRGVLALPHPFLTDAGTYLVVPMNEGISYPVTDKTISPMRLVTYGGHGICMAFWGATDGEAGHAAIFETPDDAAIRIGRRDGRLYVGPEWHPQKGRFGYARKLRYVFFDRGGHVALCKRYRAHARKVGKLKTLAEKRKANPNVDLLAGAVNVWCWERDGLGIVREMKDAGIERILWSHRRSPQTIRAMNRLPGVLTSRYDIYQDVMDPANFQYLRGAHPDWPTAAWPKDLMLDAAGKWRPGWRVRGKDGQMRPCGVLCDRQALPYAEKRIAAELKTHPYRCRFIDTTTASPWRECYSPDHPMTRSDSRHWRMELLRLVSERFQLVCGSETGHDAAVPFVHYFEGMLSLGPYRVPDAGRDMARIWQEVPPRVAKFQLGHRYRLPLWELVYHDCVVAQWYWGDYNNKLPALWLKRDLFNALYGTPPMFMFRAAFWREHKQRFVQSYRATCPVARATAYAEMTDHRFLTADRDVQQTRFANGVTVTVNFGDKPYRLPDGTVIEPMGCRIVGLPEAK